MFLAWHDLGIQTLKDLYVDNVFASFEQLVEEFSVPKKYFFRYLQVRNFAKGLNAHFPFSPPSTPSDFLLKPLPFFKKIIKQIYLHINSLQISPQSLIKSRWAEDLGEEISDGDWERVLDHVHSSSICADHGVIQCRLIHRAYWTKLRSKIYADVDPICERCKSAPASLIHMFWSCPSL